MPRVAAVVAAALAGIITATTVQADAGTVSLVPFTASANAEGSVVGPDGNTWFTERTSGPCCSFTTLLGRLNSDGSVSEFTVPYAPCCGAGLNRIIVGPDNNLWFEGSSGFAGIIGTSTTDGAVTTFPAGVNGGGRPADLAVGPDHNIWFTESGDFATVTGIARMTTSGSVKEFPLASGTSPSGITAGPDGNLWFTERAGNAIGRITLKGHIKLFQLPERGATPFDIMAAPDGHLWFTEYGTDTIGRISTSGRLQQFRLPPNTFPTWMSLGPDGNIWFSGRDLVGRITLNGAATIYPTVPPAQFSGCQGGPIAVGPDQQMWTPYFCGTEFVRVTTS